MSPHPRVATMGQLGFHGTGQGAVSGVAAGSPTFLRSDVGEGRGLDWR